MIDGRQIIPPPKIWGCGVGLTCERARSPLLLCHVADKGASLGARQSVEQFAAMAPFLLRRLGVTSLYAVVVDDSL